MMSHSKSTPRSRRRPPALSGLLAASLLALLAACSDSSVEPQAKSATTALVPNQVRYLIASQSVSQAVLYPQYDNVYVSVEGHRITIPAYSVCDPLTSGYGPGYWDRPCAPATTPIVFTITTTVDEHGASSIRVQPDVRFVPGKTVMAYMKDVVGSHNPTSYIAYCTALAGCVNEGKTDPSMTTYRDPANGIIYRRLKHFSGYNVIFGFGDDGSAGGM